MRNSRCANINSAPEEIKKRPKGVFCYGNKQKIAGVGDPKKELIGGYQERPYADDLAGARGYRA